MPINPPAPPPPIQKRALLSVQVFAYRYRKAVTVALFGAAYVAGVGVADLHAALVAAFAYIVGAAVRTIVTGSK